MVCDPDSAAPSGGTGPFTVCIRCGLQNAVLGGRSNEGYPFSLYAGAEYPLVLERKEIVLIIVVDVVTIMCFEWRRHVFLMYYLVDRRLTRVCI